MSVARNTKREIVGWICGCSQVTLPLTRRRCPGCSRPMPQTDRTAIYRQVLQELRPIYLEPTGKRWEKFGAVMYTCRGAFTALKLLVLAVSLIYLWLQMPDVVEKAKNLLPMLKELGQGLWAFLWTLGKTFVDLFDNFMRQVVDLLSSIF